MHMQPGLFKANMTHGNGKNLHWSQGKVEQWRQHHKKQWILNDATNEMVQRPLLSANEWQLKQRYQIYIRSPQWGLNVTGPSGVMENVIKAVMTGQNKKGKKSGSPILLTFSWFSHSPPQAVVLCLCEINTTRTYKVRSMTHLSALLKANWIQDWATSQVATQSGPALLCQMSEHFTFNTNKKHLILYLTPHIPIWPHIREHEQPREAELARSLSDTLRHDSIFHTQTYPGDLEAGSRAHVCLLEPHKVLN